MTSLVHIAPQLPPAICGLGDYAAGVGNAMERLAPSLRCGFIAAGHKASGGAAANVCSLAGRTEAAALWSLAAEFQANSAEPATVVLHYSGYGYDPSGAPAWLAEAVERRPAGMRLVTFFHELYATGRPWQRAFWTSGRQRSAAVRIARASDAVLTNREQSARWLENQLRQPAGSIVNLPVCSNVGEPSSVSPVAERPPTAAMFGGARFKEAFFRGPAAARLQDVFAKLGVNRLVDVGQPASLSPARTPLAGVDVEQTGFLSAEAVAAKLRPARIGLVDYFPGYFGKSGVLAAFAACGLAVIVPEDCDPGDGLQVGRHLLSLRALAAESATTIAARLQAAATALAEWYRPHAVDRHAAALLAAAGIPIGSSRERDAVGADR